MYLKNMWNKQIKSETTFLINQDDIHNKFYIATLLQTNVTIRYGRLGLKGQTISKNFPKDYDARYFYADILYKKHSKGYINIDEAKFEKLNVEAAIVGTSNKCEKNKWVELTNLDAKIPSFHDIDASRLQDPNCNPGLFIEITTRKEIKGRTHHMILFTFDKAYDFISRKIIDKNDELFELTQKVEEAIGRSLTG